MALSFLSSFLLAASGALRHFGPAAHRIAYGLNKRIVFSCLSIKARARPGHMKITSSVSQYLKSLEVSEKVSGNLQCDLFSLQGLLLL